MQSVYSTAQIDKFLIVSCSILYSYDWDYALVHNQARQHQNPQIDVNRGVVINIVENGHGFPDSKTGRDCFLT